MNSRDNARAQEEDQQLPMQSRSSVIAVFALVVIAPSTPYDAKGLLTAAIRDVDSICSHAIHGEDVTPAQVAFVRDVTPELLEALRAIMRRPKPAA